MPAVFISYRRGDASGYAGRLRESLERRLGTGQVFRDADAIEPGQDFVRTIEARIGECSVLLALIGQEWLSAADAAGRRRLDVSGDFVTLEIAGALTRPDVLVVPVLVESAPMPGSDELPASIRALAQRQAMTLRDEAWDEDVDRLAAILRKRIGGAALAGGAGRDADAAVAAPAAGNVTKSVAVGLAVVVLAIVAMLVGRSRSNVTEPPATASPSVPSSAASSRGPGGAVQAAADRAGSYGIEIPRISEFADGRVVHTLVSGSVTPRGTMNDVRLRIRFSNDGPYGANFWDSSYRLVVGDEPVAPNSGLNEVVDGHSAKYGIVSFEVPQGSTKVALRVESKGDSPGSVELNLSPTDRGVIAEDGPAGDAGSHAAVTKLQEGEKALVSSDSGAYRLVGAEVRRFVNTQRLIFTVRMINGGRYPRNFWSDAIRVLVDGLPTAPVDSPNDVVGGNSSSMPRDFVFDLPVSTERIVLRASLDDAVAEVPFNLPSR